MDFAAGLKHQGGCCKEVGFIDSRIVTVIFSWKHGDNGRIISYYTDRLTFFPNMPMAECVFSHVCFIGKTRSKL